MYSKITFTVTIIILIISFFTDLKYRKVYNIITIPAMATGLLLSVIFHDGTILYKLLWLVIFFFIGTMGIMGMGDLKLLMSIIALRGIQEASIAMLSGTVLLLIYCFITERALMIQTLIDTFRHFTLHTPIIKRSDKKYPLASFFAVGYIMCVIIILVFL